MIHLVLWMGWLLLAYFVGASIFLLRSEAEVGEVDSVLRIALIVTGMVGLVFGLLAAHIKKHLFWIRRTINIEDGGGRAIFLGFSMAATTGGGLAAVAFFAPRLLWGEAIMPICGVGIGILFLALLFPKLPKDLMIASEPEYQIIDPFLNSVDATDLFKILESTVGWDTSIKARKTACYGESYDESGVEYEVQPMLELLEPICERIEQELSFRPTNCLLNYYSDGKSTMGFRFITNFSF